MKRQSDDRTAEGEEPADAGGGSSRVFVIIRWIFFLPASVGASFLAYIILLLLTDALAIDIPPIWGDYLGTALVFFPAVVVGAWMAPRRHVLCASVLFVVYMVALKFFTVGPVLSQGAILLGYSTYTLAGVAGGLGVYLMYRLENRNAGD